MEKCKVPEEFRGIVKEYRKIMRQKWGEIGKIPHTKIKIDLINEWDNITGKYED